MHALIRLAAARSGQLLIPGALESELGLPQPTVKRYLALLEEVFLIMCIRAWSRNLSARAVAAAKVTNGGFRNRRESAGFGCGPPPPTRGFARPLLEGVAVMGIARQSCAPSSA
jgi:uncharacterized protein